MTLTAQSILVVADDVVVVRIDGAFQLNLGPQQLRCGRYGLAILQVFERPITMRRALEELELRVKGTAAWVQLVAEVKGLHALGVLVDAVDNVPWLQSHDARFDSAPVHIRMLDDAARTSSFQTAIRRLVRPSDVVLDIGTGTGILAVTAALAGARHVYAIETTAMARVAERLVEANGVADRVTVLEAHSFDVELPERADVLVSEIIGDDPLGERILSTFADARERLLVEAARIIPSRLQILVLPLEVPAEKIEALRFTDSRTAVWSDRYGIDCRPLVALSDARSHRFKVNSHDVRPWKRLAEPLIVADIDLLRAQQEPLDVEMSVRTTSSGTLNGLLVFFDADLGPGARISLHPEIATPSNSWGNLVCVPAAAIDVEPGQELRLHYHDDGRGTRCELTAVDLASQPHR